MKSVDVVTAHRDRVTLRVDRVFLKIDADQTRADAEIAAMTLAPVPTPGIIWRRPPVVAFAALRGRALGRLEEPSTASPRTWAAVGAAIRRLHDAPLPPRPGPGLDELAELLGNECDWLTTNGVLPHDVVRRRRRLAQNVLRPWAPVFIHGDLQICHVFVDDDEVTGIIDWSEGAQGDAMYDLATITLAHEENLNDLVAGYGAPVDRDLIRGWWSFRELDGHQVADRERLRLAGDVPRDPGPAIRLVTER